MNEIYLKTILDSTEQCCQLLLCTNCRTLPKEIVKINGQDAIVCLSCAERQFSSGQIENLDAIQPNIKFNKLLALLNRTFRTFFDLSELPIDRREHFEEKKEAIKEGVTTCLNLLRASIRDEPTTSTKKKIFFKTKKNFDIFQTESDEEKENLQRKTTVRGSNSNKRAASEKQDEFSPKRPKTSHDELDKPLTVISPAKTTKILRKKLDENGEETKSTSLRFTREVSSTQDESTRTKLVVTSKSSIDIRNAKGESLIHQAVKKNDLKRVQQLIDDGQSVNTIDHNGWTPLHEACAMGDRTMIDLLIKHQANINLPGGDERVTVLHEAVSNENPDETLIKYLLENGADPQLKNKNGQTARDLSNSKVVSLFENVLCKNPSNNSQPIGPPVRRRGRTTSAATVIFFTGFETTRKETLMKSVQTIFGRKSVSSAKNVENNVTHVIACGETDRIAFRTINYLRAIVLGKWILSEKWIEKCLEQKSWIDEKNFEAFGSQLEPQSNGCQLSRIKHEQNENLIFDKCQFYLYGQFHTYKKEDIADLIKITGATLLKREPKLHRIDSEPDVNNSTNSTVVYIIYESTIPDVLLDNNRLKHIKLLDFLVCIDYYDTTGRLDC